MRKQNVLILSITILAWMMAACDSLPTGYSVLSRKEQTVLIGADRQQEQTVLTGDEQRQEQIVLTGDEQQQEQTVLAGVEQQQEQTVLTGSDQLQEQMKDLSEESETVDKQMHTHDISRQLTYTHSMELQYAREFAVDYYEEGYALLTLAGSERFLLVPEEAEIPADLEENITVLRQPLENLYLAASAVMDMFVSLDALPQIRFSALKPEGWYIPAAREAMEAGEILYAGKYAAPDYERILAEGCGLAVENTMIYHTPQVKEQLERLGIPVLVDYSSYEKEPLGRTEWVRLYGLLTGREAQAEAAFAAEQAAFETVGKDTPSEKSVAFFYLTSNGEVNVRKPSDYLPRMIAMAGGSYIFPESTEAEGASSTMTLQMEEFYAAARDADYLIYNSTVDGELTCMDELLARSGLMKNFKAVQEGNVFCTARNLYQSTMSLGTITRDIHEMLAGREENLKYLYRLEWKE